METPLGVQYLKRRGDYILSLHMQDGVYTLRITLELRDYFTISFRGHLYRLARLPMGWLLSHFYFCRLTETFVHHLRTPDPASSPLLCQKTRHYLRRKRWRGTRVLPYVEDFLLFASSEQEALQVHERVDKLLDRQGMLRYPTKGFREPTKIGHHVGINIDSSTGYFFAPVDKLPKISTKARP
jgi:hypothetical protein